MAGAKEIRRQIQSIKKTQKITRAMEMVSASKVRKAQDRMLLTRPYAEKIQQVISHLGEAHPEYQHKYLAVREFKRVGYIIISSDRGLCGGLNQNLFRKLIVELKKWQQQSVTVDLCVVGAKATQFFKRYGGNIVAHAGHLGDTPSLEQLIGVVNILFNQFEVNTLDAVYIANNTFVNTMQQSPMITQLLPIVPETLEKPVTQHWDYIYEMDAKELISQLLKRYIESCVYQSVVENIASEHAARMVAMKNATENAGELINKLNLVYNKARQAAITKELAEIVAGSEAV